MATMLRSAARIEGRLDSLDDCVGRAGGGEVAGFGVIFGAELPPGLMQRSKEALRVAHLNLAAAQGDREGWPFNWSNPG